jgi:hypothetical protein
MTKEEWQAWEKLARNRLKAFAKDVLGKRN